MIQLRAICRIRGRFLDPSNSLSRSGFVNLAVPGLIKMFRHPAAIAARLWRHLGTAASFFWRAV